MKRMLYLLPLTVVAVIGYFAYQGLSGDPRKLPSAFIGKPAPAFALEPLPGRAPAPHGVAGGLSDGDLKTGKPVIVNVWASWCIPCVAEHPLVDRLAEEGYTVHGVNYRDRPADAAGWLAKLGDPYAKVGTDPEARASLEWGVYGVPETFVVDGAGVVRFKHAGALTPEIVNNEIMPILKETR